MLIGKATMVYLTGQSWRVRKSWYIGEGPDHGFRRCIEDGLKQNLVSCLVQTTRKPIWLKFGQTYQQIVTLKNRVCIFFVFVFLLLFFNSFVKKGGSCSKSTTYFNGSIIRRYFLLSKIFRLHLLCFVVKLTNSFCNICTRMSIIWHAAVISEAFLVTIKNSIL